MVPTRSLAAVALAVLGCAQAGWGAALVARGAVRPLMRTAPLRRVSAFGMMSSPQRWPEIVRSYVSEKFKTVDLDSSGEVDRTELASMFRSLMPKATEAQVNDSLSEFFAKFDADNSGDIDEEEFFVAVMSNQLLNSDMRLKEQVYVDVLNTFKESGTKLLTPSAFSALEAQLDWEGSNLPIEYSKLAQQFA